MPLHSALTPRLLPAPCSLPAAAVRAAGRPPVRPAAGVHVTPIVVRRPPPRPVVGWRPGAPPGANAGEPTNGRVVSEQAYAREGLKGASMLATLPPSPRPLSASKLRNQNQNDGWSNNDSTVARPLAPEGSPSLPFFAIHHVPRADETPLAASLRPHRRCRHHNRLHAPPL